LPGALELYAQPKYGGRRTASTPLREFGEDPASGGAVVAKTGQFGPYVSDGFVNATVPKDDSIEDMSPDRAFELLMARREKLGLEPGQAPAKSSSRGARKTTKRVVKAKGKK
jgi:DNA topoisomerase-1